MEKEKNKTGTAIALAWPRTYCKRANNWYDGVLKILGINENDYYRVGHAAVVLVDKNTNKCHYFDFGRYHAPFNHGRVRSGETDAELDIKTKAIYKDNKIINIEDILKEMQSREAYHGESQLYSSVTDVNFESAYKMALHLQEVSPIYYGPFVWRGQNCSRFVNTVLRAGKPKFWQWFKLRFVNPLTPTPMRNVKALYDVRSTEKQYKEILFIPPTLNNTQLHSTLLTPVKHPSIPESSQWLSGEGAGSWYHIQANKEIIKTTSYTPEGRIEWEAVYKNKDNYILDITKKFTVTYNSNYKIITLIIEDKKIIFQRIN